MQPSVESLCNLLAKHRLVPPDQIRSLRQNWLRQAPNPLDVEAFAKWVVAQKAITEHQLGVLLRGNADSLFLDRYTIQERVGRGRFAGVWRAVHELGATVAIKVLPPSKAKDPQTLGRFKREADLAIRLAHPNIVRTFETGETKGLHYLVMEYLQGETFEDLLKRQGKLPPQEAVRIVHQALLGLQKIFEEGLVHRDMKPANLMLLPVPGRPNSPPAVKILDIGTGRDLFSEEAGHSPQLTTASEMLGTAEYMSPEQARDSHAVDVRSDIYSLGCTLYHALTGRPPFVEANQVRLLVRHATEDPRPVNEVDPSIPAGLQQILNWMRAKDPTQRYPTPGRAAQALEVFLAVGGATEDTVETDPQMQPYLAMLKARKKSAAVPVAAPVAQPAKAADDRPATVVPKHPAPAARPARQARPGKGSEPIDVELVESDEDEPVDWKPLAIAAGVGAGVVLLLGLIVLVVYLVFK